MQMDWVFFVVNALLSRLRSTVLLYRERQGKSDAMPESLNVSASIDLKSAKLFVAPTLRM